VPLAHQDPVRLLVTGPESRDELRIASSSIALSNIAVSNIALVGAARFHDRDRNAWAAATRL
jgi:hypothetical protein